MAVEKVVKKNAAYSCCRKQRYGVVIMVAEEYFSTEIKWE